MVIHPPSPVDLNWVVASPPVVFGTVSSSEIQLRLAARGTTSDLAPAGSGGISGLQSFPILGSSEPGPSSSNVVPSSSQAEASFDQMINDMVDEIVTCQTCFKRGHFSSSCTSTLKCLGCSRVGHSRRDCARFAKHLGLGWKPKPVVVPVSEVQATEAGNISLTGYLPNLDSSASIAPSTSPNSIHLGPSTPLGSPPATPPPPPAPPLPPTPPPIACRSLRQFAAAMAQNHAALRGAWSPDALGLTGAPGASSSGAGRAAKRGPTRFH